MKLGIRRAAVILTAAAAALVLGACGSSGTISSLTDSDSTASIADDAAAGTASILTGSISQAETVVSAPEIVPQTVAAQEITSAPATSGTVVDAEPDEEEGLTNTPATVSLTGSDSEADVPDAAGTEEPEEEAAEEEGSEDEISLLSDDEDEPNEEAAPEEESYEPSGEGNTGTITGDEVNVRSTPSTDDGDDNVMFTVSYGDEVKILDSEDNWYKIEINGETGWISAAYVD